MAFVGQQLRSAGRKMAFVGQQFVPQAEKWLLLANNSSRRLKNGFCWPTIPSPRLKDAFCQPTIPFRRFAGRLLFYFQGGYNAVFAGALCTIRGCFHKYRSPYVKIDSARSGLCHAQGRISNPPLLPIRITHNSVHCSPEMFIFVPAYYIV
jgi:hypothetical protein